MVIALFPLVVRLACLITWDVKPEIIKILQLKTKSNFLHNVCRKFGDHSNSFCLPNGINFEWLLVKKKKKFCFGKVYVLIQNFLCVSQYEYVHLKFFV